MQTRWRVIQPPTPTVVFTDTFVRNAWCLDAYSSTLGYYLGMCDRYGMKNTAIDSTNVTGTALSDVGYNHSAVTSSPTYLFMNTTNSSASAWVSERVKLSDYGKDSIDFRAGSTDVSSHASPFCPYTDDVGYLVVDHVAGGVRWYTMNKVIFTSGSSTQMIDFPEDGSGGVQSSDLSIHWVAGIPGWRLVYPYLTYHLDGGGDPDYATDMNWYVYDPSSDSVIATVTYHWDTPFLYTDGYNQFSNSVLIGNKLVTFIGYDDFGADTYAEVHCLDLVSNTVTVTALNTTDGVNSLVPRGSAPSAVEGAVYCTCECYEDTYPFEYHIRTYKYVPGTNTLSLVRDTDNPYPVGNYNALADSQYAYILESTDGINQSLIRLSDGSTILTTPVTRTASPTIDEDRHGLITANAASATVTVYYDDSSTKTITIGTSAGSRKSLYLHRDRLIVLDVNGSTKSYYIVPNA